MTKKETNQLMGLVEGNWPNAFKGLTGNEKKLAFSSWYLALQDIPAKVAALAVVKLVATSKFTPTPADIREKVAEVAREARALSASELARVRFDDEDEVDARTLFALQQLNSVCSAMSLHNGPSLKTLLSSGNDDEPLLRLETPL